MNGAEVQGTNSDLPRMMLRRRIAEEVHRVVVETRGEKADRACILYAWLGALVTTILTKREYVFQVGSQIVQVNDAPEGSNSIILETSVGQEFHCWFARLHTHGRAEIVDLSARHVVERAKKVSLPVTRSIPDFWWNFHGDLVKSGVVLKVDPSATDRVIKLRGEDCPEQWTRTAVSQIVRAIK